jgi:UDP-glucose 4-epimerase
LKQCGATASGGSYSAPRRPCTENPRSCRTPRIIRSSGESYGENKLEIERLLAAHSGDSRFLFARCGTSIRSARILPGASGRDPRGVPDNLFPYLTQVAIGKLPKLRVFGNDYPTPDGTGVRDYIHVMDLVDGHVLHCRSWRTMEGRSLSIFGTGRGTRARSGPSVRAGDGHRDTVRDRAAPPRAISRPNGRMRRLPARELNWRSQLTLEEMCRDAWRWQSMNPAGYP